MGASRLVAQPVTRAPPKKTTEAPLQTKEMSQKGYAHLSSKLSSVVPWALFVTTVITRADYSPMLGVHGFFCGYDVMTTREVCDLSATCLCAW